MMKKLYEVEMNSKGMPNFSTAKEVPQRTGRWIKVNGKTAINCSACYHCSWSLSFKDVVKRFNYCPNCGADMRNAGEIARDIMHEAIDHSVWSDTVNVEEMHRAVDDKYADMRGEQDESD